MHLRLAVVSLGSLPASKHVGDLLGLIPTVVDLSHASSSFPAFDAAAVVDSRVHLAVSPFRALLGLAFCATNNALSRFSTPFSPTRLFFYSQLYFTRHVQADSTSIFVRFLL